MKDKSFEIKPNYLELAYHMDQIQIRQPKMPAAQSFIQKFMTFLAMKNILRSTISIKLKSCKNQKRIGRSIAITRFFIKKIFSHNENNYI